MEDLRISDRLSIPAAEFEERFSPSGGPGGQHANRSASRVTLSFDVVASSALDESQRRRILTQLGPRVSGGVLEVTVDESRSQWRNRRLARSRLAELIADALRPPPAPRRPTKPTKAARRRRLEAKRARSATKRLRRPPEPE